MSTKLFYYSATGNTLSVVKEINNSLNEKGEVIPIMKFLKEEKVDVDTDIIGIFTPVYAGDLPWPVKRFIEILNVSGNPYVFSVQTYCGLFGYAIPRMNKTLKKKGLNPALSKCIKMPGTVLIIPHEEANKRLESMPQEVKRIANLVNKRKKGINAPAIVPPTATKYSMTYFKKFPLKLFKVDDTKCIGCGICTSVCQMNNISIKDSKPIWGNDCTSCMACFHYCNQEAIYLPVPYVAHRPKYHNPNISIEEISNQF